MDIAQSLPLLFEPTETLTIFWAIDYFSVIVGVITGALFACNHKLDLVGVITLGLITGYGGGIIRDLLMKDANVYFTSHPDLIVLCCALCIFVFYFRGIFSHVKAVIFLCDSLSVGLFALAGASKAVSYHESFVVAVALGALTAVGGGALRDICVGETPGIFRQSNFYAVAGFGGSLLYCLLARMGVPVLVAGCGCVFIVVFLRYWSVYFDWKTTQEADLTPHVRKGAHTIKQALRGVFLWGGTRVGAKGHARKRLRFRGRKHS